MKGKRYVYFTFDRMHIDAFALKWLEIAPSFLSVLDSEQSPPQIKYCHGHLVTVSNSNFEPQRPKRLNSRLTS
jgi:hypothetical protein